MRNRKKLGNILKRIDGRSYKAYNDIKGIYNFEFFTLFIDHVQRDPFAGPSLLRVEVDERSLFPNEILLNHHQRIAVPDYIARTFDCSIKKHATKRNGSGKSGVVQIDKGGQEVLERSCVNIRPGKLEVRFSVGLPARGRRIMGIEASRILLEIIPDLVEESCFYKNLNTEYLREAVELYEDANFLRQEIKNMDLLHL